MRWILQHGEDMDRLAATLDRLGLSHSMHKVVPFEGRLIPEPEVPDPGAVILFGAYGLWREAEARGWRPGVFRIRPYLREAAWRPHLLNGDALTMPLRDLPAWAGEGAWFLRPVADGKEVAGRVHDAPAIREIARKVLALPLADLPRGSLRHDTEVMLARPKRIAKEWRLWVVADRVVTWSLYKEGRRITWRAEVDDDVLALADTLIALNPGYAPAYVMDLCRTPDGLRLIETNCLNAAGLYAADPARLVTALEDAHA